VVEPALQILDVALGLEHLHVMGIVHGDLRGVCGSLSIFLSGISWLQDNIFVTPSHRPCIADFGLSSIITSMSSI
jgi:serine/threonine protein kinase